MHSSTHAKMLRLEEKGPSYAGLSSLLFTAYKGALDRQRAVEVSLDPIIAALANGEMDAATAAEALAGVREQIHENTIAATVVIWTVMMDAFPMVREAEAKRLPSEHMRRSAKRTEARHV
jgi:predicted metal-binding membrane protein